MRRRLREGRVEGLGREVSGEVAASQGRRGWSRQGDARRKTRAAWSRHVGLHDESYSLQSYFSKGVTPVIPSRNGKSGKETRSIYLYSTQSFPLLS